MPYILKYVIKRAKETATEMLLDCKYPAQSVALVLTSPIPYLQACADAAAAKRCTPTPRDQPTPFSIHIDARI